MFVNLIAFCNLVLPLDWFTFARIIGRQRSKVDTMSLGICLMAQSFFDETLYHPPTLFVV